MYDHNFQGHQYYLRDLERQAIGEVTKDYLEPKQRESWSTFGLTRHPETGGMVAYAVLLLIGVGVFWG